MEKHFKILGLETTSTLEEVKKRFNILSKEYNPEKQTDELKEFFKNEQEKVEESYKVIYLNLRQDRRGEN
jgi:curved DNA-binding protein CbpA